MHKKYAPFHTFNQNRVRTHDILNMDSTFPVTETLVVTTEPSGTSQSWASSSVEIDYNNSTLIVYSNLQPDVWNSEIMHEYMNE